VNVYNIIANVYNNILDIDNFNYYLSIFKK